MKKLIAIGLVAFLSGCATVKQKAEDTYPVGTIIQVVDRFVGDRFYVREEERWNVFWRGRHWIYDDTSQDTRDWIKRMIRIGEAVERPYDYDYRIDRSIR